MSENGDDVGPRGSHASNRRSYGSRGGRGGSGAGNRHRGAGGRPRDNSNNEKELDSQQVQIQSKRFYIDVKENQRGRFIKLAEIGSGGRKSRIIMTTSAAKEFKNHLIEFDELNAKMAPVATSISKADSVSENDETKKAEATTTKTTTTSTALDNDGLIKSETFVKDRKRYYLDFKENQRGRFLKVSMIMNQGRSQIAIPAQGLTEFKNQLSDLLEKYGNDDDENGGAAVNGDDHDDANDTLAKQVDLPESQSFKADNKTFYFDCDSNSRGIFLKISEVRQSNRYRTSITIPDNALKQFKESLNEFIDKTIVAIDEAATVAAALAATNAAGSTAGPSASASN